MILKTLEALGPLHGFGIARRIEQVSQEVLQLNEGTVLHIVAAAPATRLDCSGLGHVGEQSQGEILFHYQKRLETARPGDRGLGADFRRHRTGIAFRRTEVMAFHRLLAKLRGLFGNRQENSDFDSELSDHLNLLTERYMGQGMTPEDACQAARRQFGNTTLLREDRRGLQTIATSMPSAATCAMPAACCAGTRLSQARWC